MRLRVIVSPRSRCSQLQRPHSNVARLVIRFSQCPRAIAAPTPVDGYVAVIRPCRRISSGPSSFSERPAPEAALVNGLAVDAWALSSDLAALTSAYDLSDPKCKEIGDERWPF
jgi:hypothetical protein